MWFGQQVAERCAKRPRQNESRPEQEGTRNRREEVERSDHGNRPAKHKRAAFEAKSPGRREIVAQRRTERIRKEDRSPVEHFRFGSSNPVDRYRAGRPPPERQHRRKDQEEKDRRLDI